MDGQYLGVADGKGYAAFGLGFDAGYETAILALNSHGYLVIVSDVLHGELFGIFTTDASGLGASLPASYLQNPSYGLAECALHPATSALTCSASGYTTFSASLTSTTESAYELSWGVPLPSTAYAPATLTYVQVQCPCVAS